MNIYDTIIAAEVEDGDQIIVDGDPIEVTTARESEHDNDEIIVKGYSYETGDSVCYELPFDYSVDLWAV